MNFGVPAPQGGYRVYELCPECKCKLEITDKRFILYNREIECLNCGHKWKLNINPDKR